MAGTAAAIEGREVSGAGRAVSAAAAGGATPAASAVARAATAEGVTMRCRAGLAAIRRMGASGWASQGRAGVMLLPGTRDWRARPRTGRAWWAGRAASAAGSWAWAWGSAGPAPPGTGRTTARRTRPARPAQGPGDLGWDGCRRTAGRIARSGDRW